ncbi:hypothetical protein BC834DRAFT_1045313 [Gloeopeniophorella convolvens]|nr:hypothetical protein BC834DRAFT_1045313 [Gloeopeniophorella convolvens]
MQPSHDEIQREVENLRDIKRRSTLQGGPGALILDPDLPTPGAQAAAAQANTYWSPGDDSSSSDSHSHEDASGSDSAEDDPFHLFWVPANMHPEIDPAQFRAFLKEHARAPGEGGLSRSESLSNAPLGRKKSMLSRQYSPSENDGVEEEHVVPLRRNRSSLYGSSGPQLTIKDLEKLDELAEEASQSRDPSKLRSVLRRSLSMNMSPSVIDNLDHAMPDPGEDADAPIIVPRPGQILRRAARTKIRKPGQTGEGAHRFNATRRGAGAKRDTPPPIPDPRSSSDFSASDDHSDGELPRRQRVLSNESIDGAPRLVRPESYSAEAFIFDAYTHGDAGEDDIKIVSPESHLRRSISPPPPPASIEVPEPVPPLPVIPVPLAQPAPALPPLQHPLPQRASSLVSSTPSEAPSRTPSPPSAIPAEPVSHARPVAPDPRPLQTPPPPVVAPPMPPTPSDARREKEKEKDKKGLFKWGGGGEKKGKKEREKEKDAGFFGSLFGSKKKQEESAPPGLTHGHSAREAAVALLGASKSSRAYAPPASPQPLGVNNYSRYPIHVERAIYRLSHIKLANPRRALYEQVLISNLMFWYLGVINKTQQMPQQPQAQQPAQDGQAQAVPVAGAPDKDQEEKDHEEHGRVDPEQAEREGKATAQLPAQQAAAQQQQQGRRGSLTKAPPPSAAGARRAEQPVRGPQYDMQHRAMEQEYGAAFAGGVPARPMSAPVPVQAQAPAAVPSPRSASPRRSRSPPPPQSPGSRYTTVQTKPPSGTAGVVAQPDGRPPGRSMSASAAPLPSARAPGRKAVSAHAVAPGGTRRPRTAEGAGEEEDVPLALWQQQQQLLQQQQRRR